MMKRITTTVIACLYLAIAYSQNPSQLLSDYLGVYHTEKIYVNHDKPFYIIGETIWCKIYLVEGVTHKAFAAEPIVYVDWINPKGEIVHTYFLKIKDGFAELDIPTEKTAASGNYTLRAYTLYQKNFDEAYLFQKEISLADFYKSNKKEETQNLDFSVEFFPEGGDLVVSLNSRVAFKTLNEKGENISVNGVIVDAEGNQIATLKTLHEGMGFFSMTPKSKTKYKARLRYQGKQKEFDLPNSLSKGYVAKYNARSSDKIKITLTTNTSKSLKGCELIGHLRGQVFLSQIFEDHTTISLALDKNTLPTGLLNFTLFDAQKRPVSERLTFNRNTPQSVKVVVDLDSENATFKTNLKGQITTFEKDKIIPSNLSISVYNSDLITDDLQGLTIENYLLLQSDLKGQISNINQYFEKEDTKTRTLLDLVLMTHGWRRFTWQQILNQEKLDLVYPTETTFSFSGQVKKEGKNKPVKANVFLNVLDDEKFAFANVTTTEDGLFYFDGFTFEDTTDLLIQANIYSEKKQKKVKDGLIKRVGKKYVDLELFNLQELPFDSTYSLKPSTNKPEILEKYIGEIAKITGEEIVDSSLWSIDLAEVTVSRKRLSYRQQRFEDVRKKYREKGIFHFGSTQKFFAEDLYRHTKSFIDIFDLISSAIPGTRVSGPIGDRKIYFGLANSSKLVGLEEDKLTGYTTDGAAFALDGIIVSSSQLNNVPPEAVDVIDFLTGLRADAIYGLSPVISILTKNEEATAKAISKAQNIGMQQLIHPGFYQAKTFYSPNYSQNSSNKAQTDFRTTLYWQPNISINNDSENFEFSTGDIAGNYLIWIEGITQDGLPFTAKKTFFINKE